MKTESIKSIINATLAEFSADEKKQIIDCEKTPGCVRDLQGASVFETLASLEDKSLRTLGNDCGWNLDGHQAAIQIAERRVWDAMLAENSEAEYQDAVDAVRAA